MKSKNIILILTILLILLAVGIVVEAVILNNDDKNMINATNNTTTTNMTTVESISGDSQESSGNGENSIDSNRPKNDPNYKGYNPYHESEVTSDGWNPKDHEVGRDRLNDGSQKIRYDDGYFRIVDKNGYVITYGYGG